MEPKTKDLLKENFKFMAKGPNGIRTLKPSKFFDNLEKFKSRLDGELTTLFEAYEDDQDCYMVEALETLAVSKGVSLIDD